jgi:hypothetical protein
MKQPNNIERNLHERAKENAKKEKIKLKNSVRYVLQATGKEEAKKYQWKLMRNGSVV